MTKKIPIPDGLGEEYLSGIGINKLAKRHRISQPTILRMLRELGIETRAANRRVETIPGIDQEYLSGIGTTELANKYEVSESAIRRMLKDLGVSMRGRGAPLFQVSPSMAGRIIAEQRRGKSYREIAPLVGTTTHIVRRVIKDASTVVPKPSGARRQLVPPGLIDDYKNGANYAALGRKYHMKADTAKKILEREGVPLRETKP